MRYVEFCAGIGGSRAGLDAAGWQCIQAIDHDPDVVQVHRLAFGVATQADVTRLVASDILSADAWVAGFPCQPFSSSGTRLGFEHMSGHVFAHLVRLASECAPPIIILENVEGLLSNKAGHTFATILIELTRLGYDVDWMVVDLRWFGVPQSRPRLFVVAASKNSKEPFFLDDVSGPFPSADGPVKSIFGNYLRQKEASVSFRSQGNLSELVEKLEPAIGKPLYQGPRVFGSLGHASESKFSSLDLIVPDPLTVQGLGEIVAPEFSKVHLIRSARYWSEKGGGGAQGLHVRSEPLAHCIGTSLGGAPLFAVPISCIKSKNDRNAFLQHSNWHREQDGLLVMRLRPERAVLLFGPHTERLSKAVAEWGGGATRKFKLVGNMVAPICAREVARIVESQILTDQLKQGKSVAARKKSALAGRR